MALRTLLFPADRIVGRLHWHGSWSPERGPVLASASVDVPDDQPLTLTVGPIREVIREGDAWSTKLSSEPIHLGFLTRLPRDAIQGLVLTPPIVEGTFPAIVHLAPGLKSLYLSSMALTDLDLPSVAALSGLVDLQTSGNNFTDLGQLTQLNKLERLYLYEKTLTIAHLDFVEQLTNLKWLVLKGMAVSDEDMSVLKERLPGVSVIR